MDFMDFIVESSKLAFSDLSSQTSHTKPIIAQMCYTATIREDFPLYQRWMICDFLKRLTSTLGETIHQCNPSAQLYLHSLSRPLLRSRARFSLTNNANCCKLRNSPFLIPQRGNAAFSLLGIREILNMGKKAMFSHLSVPPIPPFFPYLSLLSLLPLLLLFAFYPSLRFFCFVCMLLIVWNALMAFSQRAPISAALEENGARWRWCWWWYFKSCFLVPLSHPTNPPPLLFFHTGSSSLLCYSRHWCRSGMWGQRTGWENNRQGVNTFWWKAPAWQSQCWQRAGQISAVVKPHHTGQTGTAANTWSCGRSKKKRKRNALHKNDLAFSVFLKNGWINLPIETR